MEVSGRVVSASSNDEQFPPQNVLNIKNNNFWLTTGIFPQCLIISLEAKVKLSTFKLVSASVKSFTVWNFNYINLLG